MLLSKWNMAHFTEINEAPPHHQLRSRRRRGANKHGQFKKAANKSSTKGGPWSWATEVINSPVRPAPSNQPHPHLHPHPRPTVSASPQLCHANGIETANIKDLICYYYALTLIFLYAIKKCAALYAACLTLSRHVINTGAKWTAIGRLLFV